MNIGLISCCSTKYNSRTEAKNMYQSTLFKYGMKYLERRCDKIYILSAKYGLLDLNEEIDTYDITLNRMNNKDRALWSNKVVCKLKNKADLEQDNFIILAGKKYHENIIDRIKNYDIPMFGLGIGKQLKFLKGDCDNE